MAELLGDTDRAKAFFKLIFSSCSTAEVQQIPQGVLKIA